MSFSTTARMAAAIRSLENSKSTVNLPLIEDPIIENLIDPEDIRELQNLLRLQSATYEFIVSRCKFIDERLHHLRKLGVKSVVLLGAGLDTRPYRLKGLEFVEIDQESTVTMKRKLVEEKNIPHLGAVSYVGIDLINTLTNSYPALGFDVKKLPLPTVFVAEGLLYYLPKKAFLGLLKIIGSIPKAFLIADFMDRNLFDKAGPKGFQRRIQEKGESIQSLWDVDEFQSVIVNSGIEDLEITDTVNLVRADFPETKVRKSSNHIAIASNWIE